MWKIFIKDIFNILLHSFVLTKWILLSTDVRHSPFLSRKELRIAIYPLVSFCILVFYKRIFRFLLEFPLTSISMPNSADYVIGTYRKYLANAYVFLTSSAL